MVLGSRREALILAVAVCSGCSTVSAPVLRHETGETLGQKHFKVYGHYETSRIFAPGVAADPLASGVSQNRSAFEGSLLGFQGEAGVLPQLDLQLGANFTNGGGGWRVGAKYQALKRGKLAVAGMIGYSAMSGSGTVTYLTSSTPEDVSQVLSASTLDLSLPVSLRFWPAVAFYGGPMWLRSSVSGSLGGVAVADSYSDLGASLGAQVTVGKFTGDLEFAELMVDDPFTQSKRLIPFFGLSFGVLF